MSRSRCGWIAAWLGLSCSGCASATTPPLAARVHVFEPKPEPPAALTAELERTPDLFVGCADRERCPSAVGMLVVEDGSGAEAERCTASLVAHDRVLTAIHCLAQAERQAGARCPHTWLAFPQTPNAPAEWVGCARVLSTSGVVNEDGLHQEHAVLQLVRALERVPFAIDPRPPEPNSIVEVVSVTPHPIYGTTHQLSTRLCRAIDSRPAVSALGVQAASVGWLADCPIARGNSGSPVLDREGHIRAMVHGGTDTTFAFGVISGL